MEHVLMFLFYSKRIVKETYQQLQLCNNVIPTMGTTIIIGQPLLNLKNLYDRRLAVRHRFSKWVNVVQKLGLRKLLRKLLIFMKVC